jgi:hypothetical protein
MLAHLEAHRDAEHRVPDDCIRRLEVEARSGARTIGGAVRAKLDEEGLLDVILSGAAAYVPEPDWEPEARGTCTCGHSWLFHWLQAPHKCNDCPGCTGYVCGKARGA